MYLYMVAEEADRGAGAPYWGKWEVKWGMEVMEKAQPQGHRSWTGPLNGAEGIVLIQMKAKQHSTIYVNLKCMHTTNGCKNT